MLSASSHIAAAAVLVLTTHRHRSWTRTPSMPPVFPPCLNHWMCYDSSYRTNPLSRRAACQKMTIHSRSSHPHYGLLHLLFFLYMPPPFRVIVAHRRFLKARGYSASQTKQMVLDCIHWRQTVEDVGIEELYRSIDPFDVRSAPPFRTLFLEISETYLTSMVLLPRSFPDGRVSLRAGQWVSIRYAPQWYSTLPECPHVPNVPCLIPPYLSDRQGSPYSRSPLPASELSIAYSSAVRYTSRASVG